MSPNRYGERDDDQADTGDLPAHPEPLCDRGWFDRNGDTPRPCLHCRPHLAPGRRVRGVGE